MSTDEILNEREKTHGDFGRTAYLTQRFKTALHDELEDQSFSRNLDIVRKEAIEMIFFKIARIICGDPNRADHWDDIAGYAMLGKGNQEPTEFEKKYCVPLDNEKGEIHFYTPRCKKCCLSMRLGPLGLPCDDCIKEYVDSVKAKEEERCTCYTGPCIKCKTDI